MQSVCCFQTLGITAAFVLGGIGRLTGPIFLGYVYPAYGLRVNAGCVCGILLAYIVPYLVLFKRIVPYSVRMERTNRIPPNLMRQVEISVIA